MRFTSIQFINFCGFEDATLDLDRPLTVLAGPNASGKTSTLEGLRVVFSQLLKRLEKNQHQFLSKKLTDHDLRKGAEQLSLRAQLRHEAELLWVRVSYDRQHEENVELLPPKILAPEWSKSASTLAISYSSRRVLSGGERDLNSSHRTPALVNHGSVYADALEADLQGFRSFFSWFKEREDEENARKVELRDFAYRDVQLDAVRRAIESMLPGITGLRVQRTSSSLVVHKGTEPFLVEQLSEGERTLLALAADLSRRLAMANPEASDPLQEAAIVLIDDVELHLHPAWQRRILRDLLRTFPHCQFIVTTHSPQILSEAPRDAVILVENFRFVRPQSPTEGRDSNAILEEVMGANERPETSKKSIEELSHLLDEGRFSEARVRLDALAKQLSERDREVVGLRTMLHFLEGNDETAAQGT